MFLHHHYGQVQRLASASCSARTEDCKELSGKGHPIEAIAFHLKIQRNFSSTQKVSGVMHSTVTLGMLNDQCGTQRPVFSQGIFSLRQMLCHSDTFYIWNESHVQKLENYYWASDAFPTAIKMLYSKGNLLRK